MMTVFLFNEKVRLKKSHLVLINSSHLSTKKDSIQILLEKGSIGKVEDSQSYDNSESVTYYRVKFVLFPFTFLTLVHIDLLEKVET